MLNLALVALLSGTLVTGSPDGERDKNRDKTPNQTAAEATTATSPAVLPAAPEEATLGLGLAQPEPAEPRIGINRRYAFGRANDRVPIKLWLWGAYGESETAWLPNGEELPESLDEQDVVALRAGVGAQLNVIRIGGGHLGVGAELIAAQNKIQPSSSSPGFGGGDAEELDSGFGLMQANIFGHLGLNRDLAVYGGYHLDLGSEPDPEEPLSQSDDRDAVFFGADFDYSGFDMLRVFAGVEYFMPQEPDDNDPEGEERGGDTEFENGDNILWWTMGAGLRFNAFEIGTALMISSRLKQGDINPSGSHIGTIAPYLRLSPGSFPVSLFVQGAVLREYDAYGYALGGGNNLKPGLGVTAGLTIGFGGGDDDDDEMMMNGGEM
ncbi:MAG TPA: hypothetical protein VD962_08955 [Rubricoccaceae bacterium]|nr:hypothetical protein [Rubricoccaceae bacterium]